MLSSVLLRAAVEIMAMTVLLAMLVQDWRWRGIQWPLFPLLTMLLAASHLTMVPLVTVLTDTATNVLLLSLQIALLIGYVRLRFHTSLFHHLGIGDILYWLACAVYFSPVMFLLYHLTSLLASLIAHLILRRRTSATVSARIPLAGFQAASLLLLLILFWLVPSFRPVNDDLLLAYFI